jgi:hypothetical protein
MKITKQQLRQIIKEEIMKESGQVSASDIASELDMDSLMDPNWGPDGVFGELAGFFAPAFDDEAVSQRALGMLKDAARQGDVPVNYLARRLAKLVNV